MHPLLQAVPDSFRLLDLKPSSTEVRRGWGLALYRLPEVLFQGSPATQVAVAEVSCYWCCSCQLYKLRCRFCQVGCSADRCNCRHTELHIQLACHAFFTCADRHGHQVPERVAWLVEQAPSHEHHYELPAGQAEPADKQPPAG